MRHRESGYRLLDGRGLEIGALHQPARLLPGVEVKYVDALSRGQAIERFPELDSARLVEVDHVIDVDAEGLRQFPTASLDFVIANLVLDHVADPVGLLAEMFRVVRPGGHVVVSVPDKRHTGDHGRDNACFQRLLDDHRAGIDRVADEHYQAFLASAHPELLAGGQRAVAAAVRRSRLRRESVHVWDSEGFADFLDQCLVALGIDAERVCERAGQETNIEHFSVWRRRRRSLAVPAAGGDGGRAGADADALARPLSPALRSRIRLAPGDGPAGSSPGILLCGMHRSGTSALARLLMEMGAWPGEEAQLLSAHAQDNPEGYWERRDVVAAHEEFFQRLDMDWDRLRGFDDPCLDGEAADDLRQRLTGILAELQSHRPWLLKDPRLSLLLPVWQALAPDAAVVVAVRHPVAIAASLSRSPRGIFPAGLSLALWEKYLLRLLHDLAGRPAIFVSYERLLAAPTQELQRLHRLLRQAGIDALALPASGRIEELLKRPLQRHRQAEDAEGQLDHQQARLYDCLLAACATDGAVAIDAGDWPEPDRDLDQFQAAFEDRVNRVLLDQGSSTQRQLVGIEVLNRSILAAVQGQVGVLQEENRRLVTELGGQDDRIADLRNRLGETTARCEDLQQHLGHWQREHQAVARQLSAHGQAVQDMRGSLSWRLTAPLRWLASGMRMPRLSYRIEQRLYRWYYRFPGISYRRKRAFIAWLHRRLPFLTSGTQSYTLYRQAGGATAVAGSTPRIDAAGAKAAIASLQRRPTVSIIMPVYNTDPRWLREAVDSVSAQYYPHWELCVVDDCSTRQDTLDYLATLDDQRIRTLRLDQNQGIGRSTNAGLEMAQGEYIGFLDHDDLLTRDALLEVVRALQDERVDLVYSDEDKIDVEGHCHGPVYKPDFSPDYLSSNNYFCHFTVVSRALIDRVGGLRAGYDGAQDFDLVLRLSEQAQRIHHVAKVLYHWRMIPSSTAADASAKPYTWEAGRRALNDALQRRGIAGRIDLGPYPNTYHLRRDLPDAPLVSIVVPFRDQPELLAACVRSILDKSSYQNFELLLIDNQSALPATRDLLGQLQSADPRIRVLPYDQPFNYSALHNAVVPQVRGDYLLLLNNDTEVITPDWIEALLEHAQRPDVAVVGCRLLYPDDLIQHAGVIVGIGSFAGHAHHLMEAGHPGYMARPHLLQNVSAVTFACAMMRTAIYAELGGLDADNLAVAYNDVDFCLRAAEAGYRVVFTPHAELYHHESRSRGGEDDPAKASRFAAETAYMHRRHQAVISNGDPYYNVNFVLTGDSYEIDPDYIATLPV